MAAEELVERVFAGDVDGEAASAAAGPSPHLAQARDGSRERDADRGVERSDVDPELERVRGDDAEQFALREPALDVVALGRGVAGAIGSDAVSDLGVEPVERVAQDQLDAFARLHEADRARAGADEVREQLGRLVESRAAHPQVLVEQWRIPHRDPFSPPLVPSRCRSA